MAGARILLWLGYGCDQINHCGVRIGYGSFGSLTVVNHLRFGLNRLHLWITYGCVPLTVLLTVWIKSLTVRITYSVTLIGLSGVSLSATVSLSSMYTSMAIIYVKVTGIYRKWYYQWRKWNRSIAGYMHMTYTNALGHSLVRFSVYHRGVISCAENNGRQNVRMPCNAWINVNLVGGVVLLLPLMVHG